MEVRFSMWSLPAIPFRGIVPATPPDLVLAAVTAEQQSQAIGKHVGFVNTKPPLFPSL